MKFNNIRSVAGLDDSELRVSLKGGWDQELPAIKDEHGNVIVGHRRLKIAAEEKITPVIKVVTFGDGADAEAARVRLANVSNIGSAPMTAQDRKRQAERLYKSGLTQAAIAHMLGVGQKTVSRDLEGLVTVTKPARPKGGRPKSIAKKSKPAETKPVRAPAAKPRIKPNGESRTPVLDRAREIVRPLIWNDETCNPRTLEGLHGISHVHLETAIAVERALMDEPPVDAGTMSQTAQEKIDIAVRHAVRKAEVEIRERTRAEYTAWINERLVEYHERAKLHDAVIERRNGIMTKKEYRSILSCLHPDRVQDAETKKRYEHAFNLFTALEKMVLDESESPTPNSGSLPNSYQDWDAQKERVKAQRKAERDAKRNGTGVMRG
jgi:hypothetical protein